MKASDQIPQRILDPAAQTVQELAAETGRNRMWCLHYATNMVATGRWERVWKKSGRNLAPAYRVKKR